MRPGRSAPGRWIVPTMFGTLTSPATTARSRPVTSAATRTATTASKRPARPDRESDLVSRCDGPALQRPRYRDCPWASGRVHRPDSCRRGPRPSSSRRPVPRPPPRRASLETLPPDRQAPSGRSLGEVAQHYHQPRDRDGDVACLEIAFKRTERVGRGQVEVHDAGRVHDDPAHVGRAATMARTWVRKAVAVAKNNGPE